MNTPTEFLLGILVGGVAGWFVGTAIIAIATLVKERRARKRGHTYFRGRSP